MRKSGHVFLTVFLCALLAFTAYVLLDTFVIVRRIDTAAAPQALSRDAGGGDGTAGTGTAEASPLSASSPENGGTAPAVTGNTWEDDRFSITITEERVGDSTVYIADVRLRAADSLKTAFADNTYGRNVTDTTSSIADAVGAVLAVNGDYYGTQRSGYVIRNGVLYRSTVKKGAEDLVIYDDGSFAVIRESEITAEELLEDGAKDVLSFGPALLEDGELSVSPNDEVGRAKAGNPRTAIAVIDELHYLFVVSDGRTEESEGLSLYELAVFLQGKGARTAYNLDGGGSSTMVFNGTVVNNPVAGRRGTGERSVSDIVYIG